jgi:hypothetical protein
MQVSLASPRFGGFTLDADLLNLLRFPIDGLNVADSSLLVKRKVSVMHRPGRESGELKRCLPAEANVQQLPTGELT